MLLWSWVVLFAYRGKSIRSASAALEGLEDASEKGMRCDEGGSAGIV